MTGFVLVHGAWHDGSCWDPLVRELTSRGHHAVAVDLPCEEPGLGALAYAEAVESAIGAVGAVWGSTRGRPEPVVLVGHSLGGLTVPVVAQRLGPERVSAMVLVCPLTPRPGLSFDDQMRADPGIMADGFGTGQLRHDDSTTSWPAVAAVSNLYRGVAAELSAMGSGTAQAQVAGAVARLRRQAWAVRRETTPLETWPVVPTTVVVCAEDRVVAPDRIRSSTRTIPGADLVGLPGGHFPMLTRPGALAMVVADRVRRC